MYIIIGLAVVGLFSWLSKEPSRLLTTLVTTAIIAFVIFLVARALLNGESFSNNRNSDEMRKYRQAVKQSQRKYKHLNPRATTNQVRKQSNRRTRRRPTHLTVIEGRKSMKKNNSDRASN